MTKVLLVEDDNNLREIYEARLAAEGYDISAAQDGEEALEVAKKVQPDLIISDVMMPRISGFEMLDILRNTQGLKHTKVIMLTALGQEEDKTRADSLGADRYLVKSQVTLEDIVKAADELLNGSEDAANELTDTDVPAAAPQPQQSDLSPTAPPAVAAAAHSAPDAPSSTPQQPLSSFEDTNTQPTPATASSAGEPIVGGPAPVTTATVASDPLASNDQTLQAAAQALSAQPAVAPAPIAPAVAPVSMPAEPAAVVPALVPAPVVPAVTPAIIDQTPVTPAPAAAVPTAPALDSQPANQTVITPPEPQALPLPSLPEIERAMEETAASAPAQGLVNGAPGIVAPAAPTPVLPPTEQPAATPEVSAPVPAEQQPASDFARPTIGGTTPAAAPNVALPEAQTTAQESATVTDQINNFAPPQFPANVSEVVEAPGSPDAIAPTEPAAVPVAPEVSAPAEQPAPAPEMATSVQPVTVEQAPADPIAVAASAPSPSSLPATGGQRTIQPLANNTPKMDINQLAAQEGSVTAPAGTSNLTHQPGGVFTPDQSGSAADAAL